MLLLDEPTTGLDVSIQALVLDTFKRLQRELGLATIVVSHDLGVIRMLADRVMVMRNARVVEHGLTDQVLEDPQHAYTQKLVHAKLWAEPHRRTLKQGPTVNIGIISDIHANLPALQAVLDELHVERVELIVCAGDLVCYGAQPNEVLDLVRSRGIQSVAGNYDDAVAWQRLTASRTASSAANEPLKRAALAWTTERIDADHGSYLRSLPWRADLRIDGLRVTLVHAGLEHLVEWITPHHPGLIEEMVQRIAADVLVLGHTHAAYSVVREQTLVINPGAVGRSLDGDPRAAYALLDTTTQRVELRRVTYDVAAAVASIETSGMPPQSAA